MRLFRLCVNKKLTNYNTFCLVPVQTKYHKEHKKISVLSHPVSVSKHELDEKSRK